MIENRTKYQLWIFYGVTGKWEMVGFYDSREEAAKAYSVLRDCPTTPCIDDSEIVVCEVKYP
jgi:hypothetical protein